METAAPTHARPTPRALLGGLARSTRTCVGVLVVLALGWSLVSCSGSERADVLIVGDSITGLVEDDFARRDLDHRFTLRADNGATSQDMLEVVEAMPERGFELVILNLGTNDVGEGRPPEDFVSSVRRLLDEVDGAECVYLTTINEQVVSFDDETLPARTRILNDRIRALAEERDRVRLIDWNGAVREYLDRGEPDGSLLSDTVHPTPVGQRLLLDLYVEAVERCV